MSRKAFTRLAAPLIHLPEPDLDTDQIIPARFLTTTRREGLGPFLFYDRRYGTDGAPRPDFPLRPLERHGCAFLLAGHNFGCGSSREHAVWALLEAGVRAVISTRLADIFRGNALRNGLLAIELPPAQVLRLARCAGQEVLIDLLEREVSLPDGERIPFAIDPFARYAMLRGADELDLLLELIPEIERHERQREAEHA